jgi:hypothetical protein
MDPTDKDVVGNLLNKDRTFNMTYKVGSVFAPADGGLPGL